MQKFSLIAMAALVASGAASAATDVPSTFNVSIAFTSSCTVKQASVATDLAFTYTAFGAADSKNTKIIFQCSRSLTAPTFRFDTGADRTAEAAVGVGAAGLAGDGVIAGVRYTLTGTSSKSTTGNAPTLGASGNNGTADEYTVNITAAIAGSQAGDPTAASTAHTRTLYITY